MQSTAQYERDNEGYIVDPDDWNEELAGLLANEEGLELSDEYWAILGFMRAFWQEHKVAPDVRHVIKFLVEEHDLDKKEAKQHLFRLFPYGYVKQACKIAGMQRPRVWSTG
ncbi:MAG: TusE/DsrC/DsvC family sulfur relay protein [Thioalkalispiraceae bacterium]|jgi:tRNA 2-thiouridine synthesizing protein E